ncbi:MAG: hypothetical protein AB7P52_00650 [Alphaproteobacteria bacterium]
MRTLLALAIGTLLGLNGLAMLVLPGTWYGMVPGVTETGPFNGHFVRDIGAAYLVTGAALAWFALDGRARAAALAGGAFLALHAALHVGEALAGHHAEHLLRDLPSVLLPPALVLWLAWPRRRADTSRRSNRHEKLADPAFDRRL